MATNDHVMALQTFNNSDSNSITGLGMVHLIPLHCPKLKGLSLSKKSNISVENNLGITGAKLLTMMHIPLL
jgi:hypothetical protein